MTSYRHPSESPVLAVTMIILGSIFLIAAGATICFIPLFLVVVVTFAYYSNKAHVQSLIEQAEVVSPQTTPRLSIIAQECVTRLRPGKVQFFVAPVRAVNAYTFGLNAPYTVVLFAPLVRLMDDDELRFIFGHELGHVALGHTWINSILGGMAGVPMTVGAVVILLAAFRWWNRACEYSADRAGLIACGNPEKAISALVKLVAGEARSPSEYERVLSTIEAEDDTMAGSLGELVSTHPMLGNRIEEIRRWAATDEYRRLQAQQR